MAPRKKQVSSRIGLRPDCHAFPPSIESLTNVKHRMIQQLETIDGLWGTLFHPSPITLAKVGNSNNKKPIRALIDTGASVSMISPKAYEKIKKSSPLVTSDDHELMSIIQPRDATGSPLRIRGMTAVDITLGTTVVPKCFLLVCPDFRPEPPLIIGMNVIRHMADGVPTTSDKQIPHRSNSSVKRLRGQRRSKRNT